MSVRFVEVVGVDQPQAHKFTWNLKKVLQAECGNGMETAFLPLQSLGRLPTSSAWRTPEAIFICIPLADQLIITLPGELDYSHIIKRALSRAKEGRVFIVITGGRESDDDAVCDVTLLSELLETQKGLCPFADQNRFWTTHEDVNPRQRDVLLFHMHQNHQHGGSFAPFVRGVSLWHVAAVVVVVLGLSAAAYFLFLRPSEDK